MTYSKIFFHAGPVCACTGIGAMFSKLNEAGIPFGHKTADEYGTAWEAAQYANATTVWRLTTRGQNDGRDYDVPDYSLPPADAALKHWLITKAKLPPEFNKNTWIEPINEVDKNRADWLGYFALAIATIANGEGYKVSLFAFSSGEPEADAWETPGMLSYLAYCAAHQNEAAVSLHEYSYTMADLFEGFPYLVGRFQFLHDVCDENGIARPTIFISEFGWEYQHVPGVEQAMAEIARAAEIYAKHSNIRFAAIWYLGGGANWPDIGQETQRLIEPITNYTLTARFPDPPDEPGEIPGEDNVTTIKSTVFGGIAGLSDKRVYGLQFQYGHSVDGSLVWSPRVDLPITELIPDLDQIDLREIKIRPLYEQDCNCPEGGGSLPPQQYARVVYVAPPAATEARKQEIALEAIQNGRTFTQSYDDAGYAPGFLSNTAVLFDIPEASKQEFIGWYAGRYPNTTVEFRDPKALSPLDGLQLGQLFSVPYVQTSPFNAPRDYSGIGGPKDAKHEGVDFDVIGTNPNSKEMVLCTYDGVVERSLDSTGGYGKYVRVFHERNGGKFLTRYGHLDTRVVSVGQTVKKGQPVGEIGTSGNTFGEHVHFNLEVPDFGLSGYVVADVVDPTPYLPPPLTDTGSKYTGPAVTFVRGVDQPASDWYWSNGKAVFEAAGFSPKFHAGGTNHIWWDSFKDPLFNLVRILLAPDFKGDAQAIFNETTNNVAQFYARGAQDFELLNEPNIEGMGVRWNNGREFGAVFKSLCQIYKAAYPGIRLWFPGMSPGFGTQHTFIADAVSVGAFDYIYGLCEHVYTGIVDNAQAASDQMVAEVKDFQQRWSLARPLAITEFAVNRPAPGVYKAAVYQKFYAALANIPGIQAAYSFTSTWHPDPDENQEGWLENGIHNHF